MKVDMAIGINSIAEDWRADTTAKLKTSGGRISHRQFRIRSKAKIEQSTGTVYALGFKMDKPGVFVEKGVGKGRGIGSGKENPRPWFNNIMEQQAPILADQLGIGVADILARSLIK